MGCAVLFENENTMLIALLVAGFRFARNSARTAPSDIVLFCSLGRLLVSAGSDEVKFHSSSSAGAGAAACAAGLGVELNIAKGSEAG